MANVHKIDSEEARYDDASLWIERLSEGLTQEEELAIQSWLLEDPANQALLEKMARLWDKIDSLGRLATLLPQPVQPIKSNYNRAPYFAVAASIVIALTALMFWNWHSSKTSEPQVARGPAEVFYETAVGERQVHRLEDGSTITLNTASRIGVRYTDSVRLLNLEYGEVYVQVARDHMRPLNVIAGDHVIQAMGTAFNIEIKAGHEVELVVTDGAVRVGEKSKFTNTEQKPVKFVLSRSAQLVVAGHEQVMGSETQQASPITVEEINARLSWQKGNLIFRDESLIEAVREVERYTGVEFIFLDEDITEIPVSGYFKAGDVDGLLAVLKENFGIDYQREGEHRVFLYGA